MAEYIEREALIEDLDAAAKHGGNGSNYCSDIAAVRKARPCHRCCPGSAWAVGTL